MKDYEDRTLFSIIENGNEKLVHFWGYGYYAGSPDNRPYRFVEYTFFIATLSDVLKEGFFEYESSHSDKFKQYITDCDEKELIDIVEHYDDGNSPIEVQNITEDISCGCYII